MTFRDADKAAGIAEGDLTGLADAVFHDIPDAVICADYEGLIRFWNVGAERIFGFSRDEAVGQSLEIIIPERLRQRHWDAYRRMMETGRSRHPSNEPLSVPAQTKSGQTISIQFTVAPLPGPYGVVAGIVAVLRYATATFQELRRLRADKRGM
jgi:PAS domain S-box-containing protein